MRKITHNFTEVFRISQIFLTDKEGILSLMRQPDIKCFDEWTQN